MRDYMLPVIPRKEAKKRGMSWYFTGKPCKNGHICRRYVNTKVCSDCNKERCIKNHGENRDENNRARIERARENKDRENARKTQWAKNNPEKVKDSREKGKDKRKLYIREWQKAYYRTDNGRAICLMRAMVARMINCNLKWGTTEEMCGYTRDDFIADIQSKMTEGMSWANHGDWHVDHIKPISAFLKEGVTDPAVINDLSNLQPLWAEENLKKSNTYKEQNQ